MYLDEIKQATKAEASLQRLAEVIRKGNWKVQADSSRPEEVNVSELKLLTNSTRTDCQ